MERPTTEAAHTIIGRMQPEGLNSSCSRGRRAVLLAGAAAVLANRSTALPPAVHADELPPAVAFPAPLPDPGGDEASPAASPAPGVTGHVGSSSTSEPGGTAEAAGEKAAADLSVSANLAKLHAARRASWPRIARRISGGEWIQLSQLLVQPPFDDVRKAAFYIPWALLQEDNYQAAIACRKSYLDFVDHLHDLATVRMSGQEQACWHACSA